MDLGNLMSAILNQLMRILSLRISFTWFGSYFSFSVLSVFIGSLILSLSCVLFLKILDR